MRIIRFFAPQLTDEGAFELAEEDVPHVSRSLRLKPGAEVEVFDGEGRAALCELVAVERRVVTCRFGAWIERPQPRGPALTIALAPPKGKRSGIVVEKLTELGVTAFQPLLTRYGEVDRRAAEKLVPAWERRGIEACKQCRRDALPQVLPPVEVSELTGPGLVADPGADASAWEVARDWPAGQAVTVAVGPEGGFTEEELRGLMARGFRGARLGSLILRIETAAEAFAALLRARFDAGGAAGASGAAETETSQWSLGGPHG